MESIFQSWISIVDLWMSINEFLFKTCIKHMKIRKTYKRSGRFFRENRSSDDIIFTRNLNIPKLHINNILFSLELVAMACVFCQQHPARNRPLKLTPIRRKHWGVSEANSVKLITQLTQKLSTNAYISKCYYIWITYLLNIYPKNSEPGNLNLLNETHGKQMRFCPFKTSRVNMSFMKTVFILNSNFWE